MPLPFAAVGNGTALSQTEGFPQGVGVAPLAPAAEPEKAPGKEHSLEPPHVPRNSLGEVEQVSVHP